MQARRSLVWVVVVISVALVVWWFGGDGTAPAGAPDRSAAAHDGAGETAAPEAPASDVEAPTLSAEDASATRAALESAPTPTESTASAARLVVFGVLVDANDAPCADATLTLWSSKDWAPGVEAPPVAGPGKRFGYVTRSGADGRFRFDMPATTRGGQNLTVEPHRHLEPLSIDFGTRSRTGRAALSSGEQDLGVLRLVGAGALVGRVVDPSGAPLAGVEVASRLASNQQSRRTARSDERGVFDVVGLTVGVHDVTLSLPGCAREQNGGVAIVAGRDTDVGTLTLRAATTIEGRTVDTHGAPVANAKVQGLNTTSRQMTAPVLSAVDGRFVLALYEDGAHTLLVQAEEFDPWGEAFDSRFIFPSGARDVEIVLAARTRTRFVVVDALTRAPIESFAIEVLLNEGVGDHSIDSATRIQTTPEARPGGSFETFARPGKEQVLVAAEGYVQFAGYVRHDAPGVAVHTIELQPAGRVTGRVLRDGEPLAAAAVTLTGGTLRSGAKPNESATISMDPADAEGRWFHFDRESQVTATTDAEGRFSITPRGSGLFHLAADVGPELALVAAPFLVGEGEAVDLGDLHAVVSGSIHGRLLVPSNVDPAGLVAQLDTRRDATLTSVDGEGRFTFDDVEPGYHAVKVLGRGTEYKGSETVVVQVTSGVVTDVLFDANFAATCEVELHFDITGWDARGCEVLVNGAGVLGTIDANGRSFGTVAAIGTTYVNIRTPAGQVSFADQPIVLVPNTRVVAQLSRTFSALEVVLPTDFDQPTIAEHSLTLLGPDESALPFGLRANWTARDGVASLPTHLRTIDGGIAVDVPTGSYVLTWRVSDANAERRLEPNDDGTFSNLRPALSQRRVNVVVTDGERTVVRLE